MPEPGKHTFIPKPIHTRDAAADGTNGGNETVVCERCGAEMFRMHAVWRCPKCRFKTDCCGW
jgi:rubrerythrin